MTKLTEVSVAVVFDGKGRFLMTSRPEGKVYAGYWEFPGGKIEPGETAEDAIRREMREELGAEIFDCKEVKTSVFTYPHATVHLHFI
ncbi:(deoxy)nucleoside triphosphate pyrophosphohydrolase, partial [uncultured Parasutterella sp.]